MLQPAELIGCKLDFTKVYVYSVGFPGGPAVKNLPANYRRYRRQEFSPQVGMVPLRRKWQPHPVFLPGKFHGHRNLVGYSPWGPKELDTTEHALISLLFIFIVDFRQSRSEIHLTTLYSSIRTLQSGALDSSPDIQLLVRQHIQAVYKERTYENFPGVGVPSA